MKYLVAYYSRTGNTKKVGETIAKALHADLLEIKEVKTYKGFWGGVRAAKDGFFKKAPPLEALGVDLKAYDLIIVGTPVWDGLASPIRTFLKDNKERIKKYSIFCTLERSNANEVIKEAEELLEKKGEAALEIYSKEIKTDSFKERVKNFASLLRTINIT